MAKSNLTIGLFQFNYEKQMKHWIKFSLKRETNKPLQVNT